MKDRSRIASRGERALICGGLCLVRDRSETRTRETGPEEAASITEIWIYPDNRTDDKNRATVMVVAPRWTRLILSPYSILHT